jgi:hypothetical protein
MKTWLAVIFGYIFILFISSNTLFFKKSLDALSSQYPDEIALSQKYLAMVQNHDFTIIKDKIDPSVKADELDKSLAGVADQFPGGTAVAMTQTGLFRRVTNSTTTHLATTTSSFEYEFPDAWVSADVTLKDSGDDRTIIGLHAQKLAMSLEDKNSFSLYGKSIPQYVFSIIALATAIIVIAALVGCIKAPAVKWRWLWFVFIITGFVTIRANWTEDTFSITPLSFHLLPAGYSKSSPYSPVIVFASIPIGAIIFLMRRGKRRFSPA